MEQIEKEYFKLYACNVPVKGATNSCICDLQRNKLQQIPNSLFEILIEYKDKTIDEIKKEYDYKHNNIIDEYFNFLLEQEWGFMTNEPELFTEMSLDWDYPSLITNSIIDINESSNHDYRKIFKELDDLGCEFIELRFYNTPIYEEIKNILNLLENSKVRSVGIYFKYSDFYNLQNIKILQDLLTQFKRLDTVIIHSASNKNVVKFFTSSIIYTTEVIEDASHCGNISPQYFSINIPTFTESQKNNSCLNRKISIDIDGNIKNCPSMNNSYGNISNDSLHLVLENENFKKYWTINKDQIETCKDCEFRYICTDCRAFHNNHSDLYLKPFKCNYNPYTGIWENK